MSLRAIVADPLTDPVPAGWDTFVEHQRLPPMWGSGLLRTTGWCVPTAASLVMVQETGGETVALFHTTHIGPARPGRFPRPGRLPAVGLTECRGHSAATPGLAFSDRLDDRDRAAACRVFEQAVRRRAGRGQLALAYRPLRERDLAVLPARGRVRLRLSPFMVLHNEWDDLDGYLASLPRKWRAQVRKISRDIRDDRDLRVEIDGTIDPAEACWLAEVVRRRHRSPLVPRPPQPVSYFRELARLPGAKFLTYRDGSGRLLGYLGFYDDGRDLLLSWWGARGDRDGRRDNLYFDQYLRLVEVMVTTGRRRLLLGPGMTEIKARYGARPEPRWGLVGRW